jgi:hypothetical protein
LSHFLFFFYDQTATPDSTPNPDTLPQHAALPISLAHAREPESTIHEEGCGKGVVAAERSQLNGAVALAGSAVAEAAATCLTKAELA